MSEVLPSPSTKPRNDDFIRSIKDKYTSTNRPGKISPNRKALLTPDFQNEGKIRKAANETPIRHQ